jgi:hypothetical protein
MAFHISKELHEELTKIKTGYINDDGREMFNPIPHTLILDDEQPLPMMEQMKRFLRDRGAKPELTDLGVETVEEALDLDIPEDNMDAPLSRFQLMDDDEFVTRDQFIESESELEKRAKEEVAKAEQDKLDELVEKRVKEALAANKALETAEGDS